MTEWAAKVLVRLSPEDYGALLSAQGTYPGSNRSETIRKVLRASVLPADTLVRYRLPESHKNHRLFPEWRTWGPFTPIYALARAEHMVRKGFEVETVQVEPAEPRPEWPEEGE